MKHLIIILFSSFIGLSACHKDESANDAKKHLVTLTNEEIKLIGKEHNRLSIEIIHLLVGNTVGSKTGQVSSHSVYQLSNSSISVGDLFNSMNYIYAINSYQSISEKEFEGYIRNYSLDAIDNTIYATINSISNLQQVSIMNELFKLINSYSNYEILHLMLNKLKNRAENELTGLDQTSTLIAIEVAVNSAKMWLPIDQGGLGYFEQISNIQRASLERNISATVIENRDIGSKVASVICSDAIGAFSGFCRAALPYFLSGGIVNPISNSILFGSALILGTSSSLTAAVSAALK